MCRDFAVLLQGGGSSYHEVLTNVADSKGSGTELSLGFSLLGKYPFPVNESLVWFPMLGAEYHIALIEKRKSTDGYTYDRSQGKLPEDRDKNDKPYPLSAWNSLWIDVGAGLDYAIAGPLYLRSELLFGFRLPTAYEMGALEKIDDGSGVKLGGLTGNPTLKIALGYRF